MKPRTDPLLRQNPAAGTLDASSRREPRMKIAIGGKGGSGKTTIAGTLARVFAAGGQRVVALDDDSNPNLAITVGVPAGRAASLPALPRDFLEERTDAKGETRLELKIPTG